MKYLSDGKEGHLSGVACLETRLAMVQRIVLMEQCKELVRDGTSVLELNGRRETGR